MPRNPFQSIIGLLAWIALCFIAAAVGGQGSVGAPHFYAQLNHPAWAPPVWLFGPVWTVLYLLMGIAAWRVWRNGGFGPARQGGARGALILFIVQLAVNAFWSWLYFAWRMGAASFGWIILLLILIIVTIFAFRRHSPAAAWMMVPYLLWVSFATALTYVTWQMNPVLLGG
ncbi:MAG TPA: TspO/MBR family protein [Fibrobacteria bacterium]|jgi:tryptophan-rich sensory protein|nr:TspO/MBR family protein [Fibrobacteria bacterium]